MKIHMMVVLSAEGHILTRLLEKPKMHEQVDNYRLERMQQADAVVLGRKSYETMLAREDNLFSRLDNKHLYVISRTRNEMSGATCFSSPENLVTYLEGISVQNLLVCGGDKIFRYFLTNNLVDSIDFTYVTELHDGITMQDTTEWLSHFEVMNTKREGNLMHLYMVRKPKSRPRPDDEDEEMPANSTETREKAIRNVLKKR